MSGAERTSARDEFFPVPQESLRKPENSVSPSIFDPHFRSHSLLCSCEITLLKGVKIYNDSLLNDSWRFITSMPLDLTMATTVDNGLLFVVQIQKTSSVLMSLMNNHLLSSH